MIRAPTKANAAQNINALIGRASPIGVSPLRTFTESRPEWAAGKRNLCCAAAPLWKNPKPAAGSGLIPQEKSMLPCL